MSQGGPRSERNMGEGAAADSEVQASSDEDDVMIYLWGNSKVASERHARMQQERTAFLEDWRAGVMGKPTSKCSSFM